MAPEEIHWLFVSKYPPQSFVFYRNVSRITGPNNKRGIPLGCPVMEVVMRAVFSGLSTVMLLLGAVFWLGDEWRWLMDFLLQLFLFCLLGKFILVPAFFLATAFRSALALRL